MEGLAKVAAAAAVEGMDAAEAADAGATGARGRASAAAGAMRLGARLARRGASVAARSGALFGASALLPARVWRGVAILAMAASPPCRKRICEMLGGGGGGGTPGYNDGGAGPPIERALAEVDARMKWLSVPAAAVFALEGMLAHFSPGDRRALGFWRRMMPIFLRYIRVQRAVRCLPAEERHARWDQTHEWGGEKVYELVLAMSGFYVKSAQVMASKGEFMPRQWIERLNVLFDMHPPRPWTDVELSIAEQLLMSPLGRDGAESVGPADVFESVDEEALAAASIGQVHAATLRADVAEAAGAHTTDVVIKVQHRGLEALIGADLLNLRRVARFISPYLPLDILPIAEESLKQIPLEFDFDREREMQKHVKATLSAAGFDKTIYVPACVDAVSSERLLVMERVYGEPLSALLRAKKAESAPGGEPLGDKERAMIEAVPEALIELLRSYGHAIFVDGVFHADPHPGNLMMMRDGRLALLDFGQTKVLTPEIRVVFANMVEMLAEGDEATIRDAMASAGLDVTLKEGVEQRMGGDAGGMDKAVTVAYILFDTRAVDDALASPFAQGGLGQSVEIGFDSQMWMVMRFVLLLRGVLHSFGMDVSACELWRPYARKALDAAEAVVEAEDEAGKEEEGAYEEAVRLDGADVGRVANDARPDGGAGTAPKATAERAPNAGRPPSASEMLKLRALAKFLDKCGLPSDRAAMKALYTSGVVSKAQFAGRVSSQAAMTAFGGPWAQVGLWETYEAAIAPPPPPPPKPLEPAPAPSPKKQPMCGCFGG